MTASFEVSTENARILSIEAGIKINVVPGKAHATITGLTEEEVRPMAEGVTKETGVQFEFQAEEDAIVITAVGEGAHASTPEEGKMRWHPCFCFWIACHLHPADRRS